MKKYLLVLLLVFFQAAAFSEEKSSAKTDELYFRANQFYKDGNFESALNTYLEIIAAGKSGGNLYYNMGNTCFRLNMTGRAVLYYERAKIFIPRDPDLDFNLRYVRKLTRDAVEVQDDVISGILFWTKSMTAGEVFVLFALFNLFLCSALCIRIFIKKEWTYYLPAVLLVVWIITGMSCAWKYYTVSSDMRAVVIPDEIEVLSGPDSGDTLLFKLHSGTVVVQERAEDNWKLVKLPDGKRGWIKSDTVENIKQK